MAIQKLTNIGRLKATGDPKKDMELLLRALSQMEDHVYKNIPQPVRHEQIRVNVAASVATPISFAPAFTSIPAISQPQCHDSGGVDVAFTTTIATVSGFSVTPASAGIFECVVVGV